MKKERKMIGVIGAEVNCIEQREILGGIIARAQENGVRTIVFSNLYNPLEPENAVCPDNHIYDLIASPNLDAIVILSESFVNPALRQYIHDLLNARAEIPMIMVGTPLPEFDAERYPNINTSDKDDIEAITDHLIEVHGYHNLAFLTGPLSLEVSRIRIDGFRQSLEKHGIAFDDSSVYEGDFWYYSGEKLAARYLSGELPMPEALICANDYMAYGFLDAFSAADKDLTVYMSVVGYEYVSERNLHMPLLTTYQRNRKALGASAVDYLMQKLSGETPKEFTPPKGRIIRGMSCPCKASHSEQEKELIRARLAKQYSDWNLKSQMDQLLTECRTIDEIAKVTGDFMFMVRNAHDMYLCLLEDWHRTDQESQSEILVCRSTNPWADHREFSVERMHLPMIAERIQQPQVCYVNPIFFQERLFGYAVLQYEQPDTYDDSYRFWLKSISNGLEFLRLKADVRYLLQCRNISPAYDSMTGMFSSDGLSSAYHFMQNTAQMVTAVTLHIVLPDDGMRSDAAETVQRVLTAAGVVQYFCGASAISGRIGEYDFMLLCPDAMLTPKQFADALTAELIAAETWFGRAGCAYCTAAEYPSQTPIADMINAQSAQIEAEMKASSYGRMHPHYHALRTVHDRIYQTPLAANSLEETASELGFNLNYFNRIYKECFGISFHQDCIRSRIFYAAHLLHSTDAPVAETGEKSGYTDSKYFIRQFTAGMGLSPKQYRQSIRKICLHK